MKHVTKREFIKAMGLIAKALKIETGEQAYRQGTGLMFVEDWAGPGEHAIVGEGPGIPYEWVMAIPEATHNTLARAGIYAEPNDHCTLRLYYV